MRATSADGSTADTTLTISVTDVDEFDVTAPADANAAANSVSENAANGTTVGITAAASDADATTNAVTYSLTDDAGGRFAIHATTGVVTVADGSLLNQEAASSHDITVRATSADGSTADATFTINVTPVNDNSPIITSNGGGSAAAVTIIEQSSLVTVVTATDDDTPAQTLSYSISGGADAARFTINNTTGELSFLTAPRFSTPTDIDGDNVYVVTVQAIDDAGLSDFQEIALTVATVNELPLDAVPFGQGVGEDPTTTEVEVEQVQETTSSLDPNGASTQYSTQIAPLNSGDESVSSQPDANRTHTRSNVIAEMALTSVCAVDLSPIYIEELDVAPLEIGDAYIANLSSAARTTATLSARRNILAIDTEMLWSELDELGQKITQDYPSETFVVGAVTGTTVLMSVGYLVWCIRGSALLASALSTMPTWCSFDPLPVLEFWETQPKVEKKNPSECVSESSQADEEGLEALMT